jgi:hypothetical protein
MRLKLSSFLSLSQVEREEGAAIVYLSRYQGTASEREREREMERGYA